MAVMVILHHFWKTSFFANYFAALSKSAYEERSTQTQSWVSTGGKAGFSWRSDGHSRKYEEPVRFDNHRYDDRAKSIARCESLRHIGRAQSQLESELAIRRAKRASSEMKLRSSREPRLVCDPDSQNYQDHVTHPLK